MLSWLVSENAAYLAALLAGLAHLAGKAWDVYERRNGQALGRAGRVAQVAQAVYGGAEAWASVAGARGPHKLEKALELVPSAAAAAGLKITPADIATVRALVALYATQTKRPAPPPPAPPPPPPRTRR